MLSSERAFAVQMAALIQIRDCLGFCIVKSCCAAAIVSPPRPNLLLIGWRESRPGRNKTSRTALDLSLFGHCKACCRDYPSRSQRQEPLMVHGEMTIADVLKDPLIRQMMRADRVSLKEMKRLLQNAARTRKGREVRQSHRGDEAIGAI
jgi:hypothetical protein